jgi:hypothetical protein
MKIVSTFAISLMMFVEKKCQYILLTKIFLKGQIFIGRIKIKSKILNFSCRSLTNQQMKQLN